jgi:hypothetical protein
VVVLIHRISSLVGSKCGTKPLVIEEKGEKGAQSLQERRRRRREKARVGRWRHFFLHHLYSLQLDVSKQQRLGEGERVEMKKGIRQNERESETDERESVTDERESVTDERESDR